MSDPINQRVLDSERLKNELESLETQILNDTNDTKQFIELSKKFQALILGRSETSINDLDNENNLMMLSSKRDCKLCLAATMIVAIRKKKSEIDDTPQLPPSDSSSSDSSPPSDSSSSDSSPSDVQSLKNNKPKSPKHNQLENEPQIPPLTDKDINNFVYVSLFEGNQSPHLSRTKENIIKHIYKNYKSFMEDSISDGEEIIPFSEYLTSHEIKVIPIDITQTIYIIQDGNYFVRDCILTNDAKVWKHIFNTEIPNYCIMSYKDII